MGGVNRRHLDESTNSGLYIGKNKRVFERGVYLKYPRLKMGSCAFFEGKSNFWTEGHFSGKKKKKSGRARQSRLSYRSKEPEKTRYSLIEIEGREMTT